MWDYVNFFNTDETLNELGADPDDYWEFRRIRLFMEGKGYGIYEYKIQLDFEPEGSRSGRQDQQAGPPSPDNDKDSAVGL